MTDKQIRTLMIKLTSVENILCLIAIELGVVMAIMMGAW